jgi:modulator of FtsH protease HflK
MREIYGNVTKMLVESRQGSNLLFLPLDKIMQQVAQGGAATAHSAEPAPSSSPSASTAPPTSDARTRDNSRSRERESR